MTTIWHHSLRVFQTLTPQRMATSELLEAELSLLEAYSAWEHAASVVQYNENRVDRLKNYLGHDKPTQPKEGAK